MSSPADGAIIPFMMLQLYVLSQNFYNNNVPSEIYNLNWIELNYTLQYEYTYYDCWFDYNIKIIIIT